MASPASASAAAASGGSGGGGGGLAKPPFPPVPRHCVVTGAAGFVGRRLVEMLVERGAARVVALDVAPQPDDWREDSRVQWLRNDVRDLDALVEATRGADCVWHNAAAVGPYHPQALYEQVNYVGTLNVIEACRRNKVRKIVMSSSPSTRFDGSDVDGLTEDEMPALPMRRYVAEYARTKAMGEVALRDATRSSNGALLACAVAPHQVYGPRDNLFLPNLLEACGTGRMRVFGSGRSRICFTHIDNYCHGLIIAERALVDANSPAVGKFYIVTDGATHPHRDGYAYFYTQLDEAARHMGFTSIYSRFHLPYWFIMPVAYLCSLIGWITGIHLKLTPFTVLMLTMHRWFKIGNAERDLNYAPVVSFADEWPKTLRWFKAHWLPTFQQQHGGGAGMSGLAHQTANKISVEAAGAIGGVDGGKKKA